MTRRLSRIADFAGVSEVTVSRVLNGSPDVAPRTRDIVLTALDVFGYPRPATSRRERAPLVGLVVPDLQNPVFPAFAEAMAGRLNKAGLIPVLCTRTADGVSEANYIEMLLGQNIGGIVFIGSSFADAGPEQGRALREREVPMVLVNAADENAGVAQICADDTYAAHQALTHLEALGHERIGLLLGPVGHVPSARKLAGYAAFVQARGLSQEQWRPLVAHTMFSMEGGATAAARLLADGVTGLVCASDALALGAVRGARKSGFDVPRDVSVVGFDDSLFMVATDPPLTTARQPVQTMAAAAVSALLAQMDGHAADPGPMLFECELIVRGSTAVRRGSLS
ncbi:MULTISPECIES: LacI family DNA-binding transcriptional regulator [unclassified Streptomyces]|uniref:LacI family DNA-binding transcriptional regulator n=1 Tax=unclassified Streptomyces TaxID=2593676 RepID=UPI0021C87BE6|nr:LacI family DNA-binding transcriptional regulator [Streptomyces sp. FIT100]UUN28457.1 LacI family transcriptional regulator [Streptomyces sp. FIT100]